MFTEYQICPYTGLRSFTEEESLYFKGREDHIQQATEQLQRNKFLMLTGASGDGKSSLVYAGIVPNARAGFLKSKYTHWAVADFRPERTPFKNLCRALAKQLGISNPSTVEAELQHGFSALVDLYKNSNCYIDTDSLAWKEADDKQKSAIKRSAANLVIIVDQFEEFFTNPENYRQGVPSGDSNLVLNVLLETARIALEEDLPIYIIFTMRSDFIGQCAAFRSLPEYIGFSQFFVPRLNRTQLQQVIEEPATLSGNRITRRLTERLIHDISEGVDQLPILQHALNQIWHAASQGTEEMDLIHYAMVGGMPAQELPDDHVARFTKWFAKQSEKIKQFYQEPNLQNVLDTHANKLYKFAAEQYHIKTGKQLLEGTAREVIRTTFTCLTKIDQSRAVRNRMTLKEIHNILGKPEIDITTLGQLLNIFRESGNTFIRPFITEDSESEKLSEDSVLDITHESLIRNWELLEQWAKGEFDHYNTFLDFRQQLDRWVDSGYSSGFLLSIGPLTYFESWYNTVKPNAWWIARYTSANISREEKIENAKTVLANSREFLRQSNRKHLVTRTVLRYGPKKIGIVLGVVALLIVGSLALRGFYLRQNSHVLQAMKAESLRIGSNPKNNMFMRGGTFAAQLQSNDLTVTEIINHPADTFTKINTLNRLSIALIYLGKNQPEKEIMESLRAADAMLEVYSKKNLGVLATTAMLTEITYMRTVLELGYFYNPTPEMHALRQRNALRAAALVKHILREQPDDFKAIDKLNLALEDAINREAFSKDDLQNLIKTLSPFENSQNEWMRKKYAQDALMNRGTFNYAFNFQGLYQELAYLYAAIGNTPKALQCVDSLLKYNQNYYNTDYTAVSDNATNIAGVFYTYRYTNEFVNFIQQYCQRKKISEVEFYQRLIGRCNASRIGTDNVDENSHTVSNLNLEYATAPDLDFYYTNYRKCIERTLPDANARNFYLAVSWKDEALMRLTRMKLQNNETGKSESFKMFDRAVAYYLKTDKKYLDEIIRIPRYTDLDAFPASRKILFLYPDYRTAFSPDEPRNYYFYYDCESFIQYILDNNLFDKLYTPEDMTAFSMWCEAYFVSARQSLSYLIRKKADLNVLIRLEQDLEQRNASFASLHLLYLAIGNEADRKGDVQTALRYYSKLDMNVLMSYFSTYGNAFGRELFYETALGVSAQLKANLLDSAYAMIRVFKSPVNRSTLYAFAATKLMESKINSPLVQQLIDSAQIEIARIENLSAGQPNRIYIAQALTMQDPAANVAEANRIVKNVDNKIDPSVYIARSFAFHQALYSAREHMPENLSDGDKALFIMNITEGHAAIRPAPKEWEEFNENLGDFVNTIIFVNEDI